MKVLLMIVVLLSGCTSYDYKCTAGDHTYYSNDYSAIVVNDEVAIIGDCNEV